MDFDSSMKISASGLSANRVWLNVVASNLANANNTRAADGKPYARRTVIYESAPSTEQFDEVLQGTLDAEIQKVQVVDVTPDGRDFMQVYDPYHPDADEKGVVLMPNINPVEEMANMMNATRSYEANLAALNTAKQLAIKTLDIGR